MRQEEFETNYQSEWLTFEQQIELAEAIKLNRTKGDNSLKGFAENYRKACYCLALARERQYSPALIDRLEILVFRGHQSFYQKRLGVFQHIIRFVLHDFPFTVRQQASFFWSASAIFYLPLFLIFFLTLVFPDIIYMIVDPQMVAGMERMYDPTAERFGTERASESDFQMFGYYIRNNIGIAFNTFAGGILATLGSLFFLLFNGLVFGAIAGHIVNIGYQETFFSFVIGHGAFELTGIVIAGAAGLKMGWALIAPGQFSRKDALVLAAKEAVKLIYGAVVLLLLAAFVEAFWSSTHRVDANIKYWVGSICWLLVIGYFGLLGRKNNTDRISTGGGQIE